MTILGRIQDKGYPLPELEFEDADQVAAYTQGLGQLHVRFHGYAPCHNTEAVVSALDYDP